MRSIEKIQLPHPELNPRPTGLSDGTSTNYTTACPLLHDLLYLTELRGNYAITLLQNYSTAVRFHQFSEHCSTSFHVILFVFVHTESECHKAVPDVDLEYLLAANESSSVLKFPKMNYHVQLSLDLEIAMPYQNFVQSIVHGMLY
jgi:hypothetical protein